MNDTYYFITDTERAVYDLQFMLRALSEYDEKLPSILPDGIYGDETREAVQIFQSQNGLPSTGVIDFTTHSAILESYALLISETDNAGLPIDFSTLADNQLSPGERSEYVLAFKLLLSRLSVSDDRFTTDIDNHFDAATTEKVILLQQIFGHEQTGFVDLKLWKALSQLV